MLALVYQSLRARCLEIVLCAIAVALPIAAVFVLRSVTASTEKDVHETAHALGPNMLVVSAGTPLREFYERPTVAGTLPEAHIAALERSSSGQHIRHVRAELYGRVVLRGVERVLVGHRATRAGEPRTGTAQGLVWLDPEAAMQLGAREGAVLSVGGRDLTFSGSPPKGATPVPGAVFVTLEDAQAILGKPAQISALRLGGCWCKIDVPTLGTQIERLLPETRAITAAGMLAAQKGTVEVVRRFSIAAQSGALLLVGAVIVLMLLHGVRQQKRDIGLLLAIGARPLLVTSLVAARGLVMGLAGLAGGYLVALAVAPHAGQAVLGLPVRIDAGAGPGLMGLVLVVSIAASLVASLSAARVAPSDVLREE